MPERRTYKLRPRKKQVTHITARCGLNHGAMTAICAELSEEVDHVESGERCANRPEEYPLLDRFFSIIQGSLAGRARHCDRVWCKPARTARNIARRLRGHECGDGAGSRRSAGTSGQGADAAS